MLSVIIPTLNAEPTLGPVLSALVPGAVEGLVKDVIIADGGSKDATAIMADTAGARLLETEPGRGRQLAAGAEAARGEWLLFLHADTVLEPGWIGETRDFIEQCQASGRQQAAYYRFALDDLDVRARILERIVALRCSVLALPYGDQGLLMSRMFYREIGGFRAMPLMEDVDLVRRIGWRRLKGLRTVAVTSAERYRRDGYLRRMTRNAACLGLYYAGMPPGRLARLYG